MRSLESIREAVPARIIPTKNEPQVWLGFVTRFPIPYIGDSHYPYGWQPTGRVIFPIWTGDTGSEVELNEPLVRRLTPGMAYAHNCHGIHEYERIARVARAA